MNRVDLIGRLTADAELRYNSNNVAYSRFNLAVNRHFTNAEGKRETDFISCVAWRKTAELIKNHFSKGSEIGVSGRIQTGSYDDKDGNKRYTVEVVVDEITFIGSKKEEKATETVAQTNDAKEQEDPFADFGDSIRIDDNLLD